jgi:predicted nucleotidyltransferase
MGSLSEASLSPVERRVLDRFVELLRVEYADRLLSVWLFGSRARGEKPGPESDVDLLVVIRDGRLDDHFRAVKLVDEAADAEGASPVLFSVSVYDPAHIAQRRAIRSFFMQEVDRDKVVLAGGP